MRHVPLYSALHSALQTKICLLLVNLNSLALLLKHLLTLKVKLPLQLHPSFSLALSRCRVLLPVYSLALSLQCALPCSLALSRQHALPCSLALSRQHALPCSLVLSRWHALPCSLSPSLQVILLHSLTLPHGLQLLARATRLRTPAARLRLQVQIPS